MSYHGYDVTDYTAVNPQYGTLDDFDRLVSEARARGITIYLDYVMNHTGRNHPWFTQATSSLDNPYRDYYTFSQDPAADIQAGRVPMIASEGAAGYKSGEWFAVHYRGRRLLHLYPRLELAVSTHGHGDPGLPGRCRRRQHEPFDQ